MIEFPVAEHLSSVEVAEVCVEYLITKLRTCTAEPDVGLIRELLVALEPTERMTFMIVLTPIIAVTVSIKITVSATIKIPFGARCATTGAAIARVLLLVDVVLKGFKAFSALHCFTVVINAAILVSVSAHVMVSDAAIWR